VDAEVAVGVPNSELLPPAFEPNKIDGF